MSFDLVETTGRMEIAAGIGKLACNLDDYKNSLPLPLRIAAKELVDEMHKFAQTLAGDAVDALYAPEEDTHP